MLLTFVTVLGASGAEASGGGNATTAEQQLAGHAATLLVPTLSLLRALDHMHRNGTSLWLFIYIFT